MGLLEPVIVNKTTGNLVGGHQRLSILDSLEGGTSYMLDVAMVELSEKEEKEQNIFLNNPNAQGQWDLDKLKDLVKDGIDIEDTGFDSMSLEALFPLEETTIPQVFNVTPAQAAQGKDMAEVFGAADGDDEAEVEAPTEDAPEEASEAPTDTSGYGTMEQRKERVQYVKEQLKEQGKVTQETEMYAFVIFRNAEDRERFMEAIGMDKNERYVSGERLWAYIKA